MSNLNVEIAVIEEIKVEVIRTALANWRRGLLAPETLLKLRLLGDQDLEYRYVRDVMLYDAIVTLMQERLTVLRNNYEVEQLQPKDVSREAVLAQLQLDFTQASKETVTSLMAYSALYFRYITLIEIPITELAVAAGVTPRHFRRSVKTGISLLAQELRRLEYKAHHTTL